MRLPSAVQESSERTSHWLSMRTTWPRYVETFAFTICLVKELIATDDYRGSTRWRRRRRRRRNAHRLAGVGDDTVHRACMAHGPGTCCIVPIIFLQEVGGTDGLERFALFLDFLVRCAKHQSTLTAARSDEVRYTFAVPLDEPGAWSMRDSFRPSSRPCWPTGTTLKYKAMPAGSCVRSLVVRPTLPGAWSMRGSSRPSSRS